MFTTRRKGIIAILCAVFAAALIACAISLAPSATRTTPVYAAEGDLQITEIVDANDSSKTYQTVEEAVVAGIEVIIDTAEDGSYKGYTLYNAMWTSLTGRTLILLQDCETSYMKLSNNSIIDLNGHDLVYTGTATIPFNTSGITAAITDTSVSGTGRGGTLSITGERDGSQSVFEIAGTTLNVSNINVQSTGCVFYPRGAAVLNITNCDITTSGVFCVSTNAGSQANYGVTINIAGSSLTAAAADYDDCAVMMNVSGSLNIENSVITGDRQGLFVRAGDVTVVNSEIVLTGNWAAQEVNDENAYHNEDWQSGNEAPSAAIVAGNRNGTYFADANVTIENSTITAPESVPAIPAIYADATNEPQGTAEESYSSDVSISGAETSVTGSIVNNATDGDGKSIEIAVTGGTFTADVAEYIPEGTILTQDESGKIIEDESNVDSAVAEVGGVKYTTLQGAINVAADGAVVTMLKDAEEDIVVAEGQDITLDLNGKTLTNESDHTITNSGTLTITDTVGGGTVDNITHGRGALVNYGTATLNGGTFTRSQEAGTYEPNNANGNSWYTLKNYGYLTINEGATVTTRLSDGENAVGGYSSLIANGYQNSTDYTNNNGLVTVTENVATIVINGGTFSGGINTLKNDEGSTATINGGVFTNVTQAAVQNWNNLTINGGTFNAENDNVDAVITGCWESDIGSNGTSVIEGGVFNGAVTYIDGYSGGIDYEISGGTFCEVVDADYIAEGSVFYPAEDGSYKVVTEEEFETVTDNAGVALMNGVVYDSLADAVDAAPTDGTQVTITLIDTDGDGIVTGSGVKVVEGKNIVIDFDGLTYDVTNPVGSPGTETNGFQLLKGSTVKMMNGTLVSDTAKILIQNYCDLTIDDMTLDMSDCGQVQYVISNNSGDTVITGDTTIVAAPNQVAFDIYYWPSNGYTDGVSVTFDKNFIGTVTGTVQYGTDSTGATEDNWQTNKANLAIENGTFDITFDVYSGEETEAAITISGGKFTTKFSDSYLADGYALSEYNGMFIPVSSSTDGTLLEEIAQLRQEIDEAIAAINGELEGGDAATLADAVTALIGKMNELEDKIAELDENMVTDADLQAMKDTITTAYNAAVTRVKAELKAEINRLGEAIADLGDVKGQLDELKAAYEAADALLSAEIDGVSADLAELESAYQAADEALLKVITNLRTELSEDIYELRTAIEEMGDVNGQLDELKAAYEAADALLNADIDSVSAALAELESTYKAADDAIWNAIYALRDADSGMTTALWVIGVIAVLALCAGVAGVAFAIVRTKRS